MTESFPIIRINQAGYAEPLPVQVAVLSAGPVTVYDLSGTAIKTVETGDLPFDEASGDHVKVVDLGILTSGEYKVSCGGESRQILVKKDPWQEVTNALIKGLYFQRCGCELDVKYAGKFKHPACHTAPALEWDNNKITKTVIGGWHDAGDYGKYVGPGAVTVAHMLYAYLLCGEGCIDILNIPESGNGVPDILNEARYELEWMLKMQREDGAFYHKLTKSHFAPFIMPQDDKDTEYLMPVSHTATAAACACLSLASRVYKEFDEAFSDSMLEASLKAYEWLDKNPDFIPFVNPEGVRTGMYGDKNVTDELLWAACELYESTGQKEFLTRAENLYSDDMDLYSYGWADVTGLAVICILFEIGEYAGDLYKKIRGRFIDMCRKIAEISDASGYGTALPADRYIWGSILPIMGNAMSLIMYEILTGDDSLRYAALLQWNYALGLNALDISFVTGFGDRRVMNIHHRPSGSDGIEEPVPGLISGGPNKGMNFPQTKERLGDTPSAKYFLDELPSADTNEIAIYWNSPAIFVGAFFSSLCS